MVWWNVVYEFNGNVVGKEVCEGEINGVGFLNFGICVGL